MTLKPIVPFEPIRSETIPKGDQWTYQVKWDGVRIILYNEGSVMQLFNRKLRERTLHYPELTRQPFLSAKSFITDGEVIALAENGRPSFHEVMRRDGIRRMERVNQAQNEVPITYMIFDLLYFNGEWINKRPLKERLEILANIIIPNEHVQLVTSHSDGKALFKVIQQNNMEGIICKDLNSPYAINGKDDRWIKVKNYGDVIAVIGGFTLNGGIVNSVLLGLYDDKENLYFIGKVGTGKLKKMEWVELTTKLKEIETDSCPFLNKHPEMKGAYWVNPIVTVKVQYTEWRLHEGRTLRQPSIQAFVNVISKDCRFPR